MSFSTTPSYQYFHKYVADAYNSTIAWLDKESEVDGYRKTNKKEVGKLLKEETFLSAAFQFHKYFPTHYFKVTHTLKEVIGLEKLAEWLNHNPRICIVDIGMHLQDAEVISHPVEIFCLGIDPNAHAVVLYKQFLENLETKIELTKLNLTYAFEPEGIPQVTSWLIDHLIEKRGSWDLPSLAQVFMMQLNVVSPLSSNQDERQKKQAVLRKYGADANRYSEFGREEALAYKSIFENVGIDNLHILTIGTDHHLLDERVKNMEQAISQVFNENRHKAILVGEGPQKTTFINPQNSFFAYNRKPVTSNFHVNIMSIANQEFRGDREWHEVISEDNLKAAWARTRRALLRESFVDEVEIRLFENNLEQNLSRMRRQLIAYAEDVARQDDVVAYKVPKNMDYTRPRGLSRMEEELLSVAIIQKLGEEASRLRGSSYAYRVTPKSRGRDTEYLYAPWFQAYQEYINKAREEARKHPNGAVLRTDINSFYTQIIQHQLIEATQGLTKSERIQWLIRLLLSKNLDNHEFGKGIVQGSIGSGFYGNIYLTNIDTLFGSGNEWGVSLFRYVDDMIFVIPEPSDGRDIKGTVKAIQKALEDELKKLNLELNTNKTEVIYDVAEFIKTTENDTEIEQISENFNHVINALWILDEDNRANFRNAFDSNNEIWWYRVQLYNKCLYHLGIYTSDPQISRNIFKYLFHDNRRRKELKRPSELILPSSLDKNSVEELHRWVQIFIKQNSDWIVEKSKLQAEMITLFRSAWDGLQIADNTNVNRQNILERRLRFAANKLSLLGFGQITDMIVKILIEQPWLFREPLQIIESLAYQGFSPQIVLLIERYESSTHEMREYLTSVVLRAIRFLPDIKKKPWSILTKYALHGSMAERLMATETWLHLNHTPGFQKQEHYVSEIEEMLKDASQLPTRLSKNYLLLLGAYQSKNIYQIESGDDPVLINAHNISSKGEVSNLFDYQEPELIRENFYTGQRADDDVPYDDPAY